MARTRRRGTGSPSSPAASREGGESDASGDTNVLPSSPESAMSLSDGEGGEGASDPPTTTEFLANDLGMRMPELASVLHEVKTDKHTSRLYGTPFTSKRRRSRRSSSRANRPSSCGRRSWIRSNSP